MCGWFLKMEQDTLRLDILLHLVLSELPIVLLWSRSGGYGDSYSHLGCSYDGSMRVFNGDSSRGDYGVADIV